MRMTDRVHVGRHNSGLLDIGGTDVHNGVAAADWIDMALYDQVTFYVFLGPTWNAADQLDTCHVNQANTAIGGGTKALVPAVNLDQIAANAAGEIFTMEVTAAHCDTENGFHWIRAEVGEAGNTGVDECVVIAVRYGARFQNDDMVAATDEA